MAVDCPAIGVPPDIEILVGAGFGVELRDEGFDLDLGLSRASASRKPAEDTCCFGAALTFCLLDEAELSLALGGVPGLDA